MSKKRSEMTSIFRLEALTAKFPGIVGPNGHTTEYWLENCRNVDIEILTNDVLEMASGEEAKFFLFDRENERTKYTKSTETVLAACVEMETVDYILQLRFYDSWFEATIYLPIIHQIPLTIQMVREKAKAQVEREMGCPQPAASARMYLFE